mgnify:CR=1 FL=1
MFKSKFWTLGLETTISIVIGLITTYWVSGTESFLIGLIVFFCIEMVRVRFMAEQSEEVASKIEGLLELLQQPNPVSELALLFGLRNALQLTGSSILVNRDKAWEFWRECMLRTKIKWSVISYSVPDEGWLLAWNNAVLVLQSERIASGCQIERVFLVETENEVSQLQQVMQKQIDIGIKVSYALKKDVSTERVKELLKITGTMDFAVIDGSWLFFSNLDKSRKVVSVGAARDPEVVKCANTLFEEISFMATNFEGTN